MGPIVVITIIFALIIKDGLSIVNAIALIFIDIPFIKDRYDQEGLQEYVLSNISLGRIGQLIDGECEV